MFFLFSSFLCERISDNFRAEKWAARRALECLRGAQLAADNYLLVRPAQKHSQSTAQVPPRRGRPAEWKGRKQLPASADWRRL